MSALRSNFGRSRPTQARLKSAIYQAYYTPRDKHIRKFTTVAAA